MIPLEYERKLLDKAEKRFKKIPAVVLERIHNELSLFERSAKIRNIAQPGDYWRGCSLLSSLLGKKTNQSAYVTDSGMNGNMIIGYLLGLSEVLPLPPFYHCPNCGHYEEGLKGIITGYSLPKKACPDCQTLMEGLGIDIPFSDQSLNKENSVGLIVSHDFLKRNHLNVYETFRQRNAKRNWRAFSLTITRAVINFQENPDASIIERMTQQYDINAAEIDYNDKNVFNTIYGENKYGISPIVQSRFKNVTDKIGRLPQTFDSLVRIMGFYSCSAADKGNLNKLTSKYKEIDLSMLPTNREDLNTALAELSIENTQIYKAGTSELRKLRMIYKTNPEKENIKRLVYYLKMVAYFEKKCTIMLKSLVVYRLAYLKTYYPKELIETIKTLGYSTVTKSEMRLALSHVRLFAKLDKEELTEDELALRVSQQFKGYVECNDEKFRNAIKRTNIQNKQPVNKRARFKQFF